MRQSLVLLALATMLVFNAASQALEGGVKDPISGLVWTPSQTTINGSMLNFKSSVTFAANYLNYDLNAQGVLTAYSDWRLPTLAELTAAHNHGILQSVNYASGFKAPAGTTITQYFWTADTRGSKATVVGMTFDDQGTIVSTSSKLISKKDVVCGGFMVRP